MSAIKKYFQDEEEEGESNLKDFILKWQTLLIVLIVIFMLVMRGRMGLEKFDKAMFWGAAAIIGVFLVESFEMSLKNKSPKLIWNPGFSTTNWNYQRIGNFLIFKLGGIKAYGLDVSGHEGTIVVPTDSVTKVGVSGILRCRVDQVEIDELPRLVRGVISQYGYKPPYLFGMADEEQYLEEVEDTDAASGLKTPTVGYLIQEIKELNRISAFLDGILSGKFGTVEEIVAAGSRIREKAEGGKWKKALEKFASGE